MKLFFMNELIESVSVYINSPTEVLTGSDSGISPISICKYEWYVRNYHNHTVYHYDKSTEWRNDLFTRSKQNNRFVNKQF